MPKPRKGPARMKPSSMQKRKHSKTREEYGKILFDHWMEQTTFTKGPMHVSVYDRSAVREKVREILSRLSDAEVRAKLEEYKKRTKN